MVQNRGMSGHPESEALTVDARPELTGGRPIGVLLSPGFTGFTTPVLFRQFNRGLRARVNLYTGNYAAALTDSSTCCLTSGGTSSTKC